MEYVKQHKTLAVLLTCFNRKEMTLRCIAGIYQQQNMHDWSIAIFLVNDGCTDGTPEAVAIQFPEVTIIQGSGNLFWNKGMHLAFDHAIKNNPDYFLWLNDDVELLPDAFCNALLFSSADSIVVGSTKSKKTGLLTYGGWRSVSALNPFKFVMVQPNDQLQSCDTINGNFVVIGSEAAKIIGNIDEQYSHACGDTDYGLQASKEGVAVNVLPGFIGYCEENSPENTWADTRLPILKRWYLLRQRRGLPVRDWLHLCRKHGGMQWPLVFIFPYIKFWLIAPLDWLKVRNGN